MLRFDSKALYVGLDRQLARDLTWRQVPQLPRYVE